MWKGNVCIDFLLVGLRWNFSCYRLVGVLVGIVLLSLKQLSCFGFSWVFCSVWLFGWCMCMNSDWVFIG